MTNQDLLFDVFNNYLLTEGTSIIRMCLLLQLGADTKHC